MDATSRLLRERGVQGLRVRDVAAYAGMSPGAVLYHFDSTDDLLYAVHQQAVDDYLDVRRTASSTPGSDARERLMSCFTIGLPGRDGTLIELLYEVHGMARRSLRHAELVSRLWTQELELYGEIIRDGMTHGHFHVQDVGAASHALLALEDGLALHLVSRNEHIDSAVAADIFRRAAADVLDCPSLTRTRRSRSRGASTPAAPGAGPPPGQAKS